MNSIRLNRSFFSQNALAVAPNLLGKVLFRKDENGISKFRITEVEAYGGEDDLACHASKGRTKRTEIMYRQGGVVYVYLIYGMYWMLNFVTGEVDNPQAVLIRGVENINGPGRVGRALRLDKSFNGENLSTSNRLWIEDEDISPKYITMPRVGIDYAGDYWKNVPWRFVVKD